MGMPDQLHQALVRQSDESIFLVLDGYAKSAFSEEFLRS
jgi:hypothetical protein